MPERPTLSFLRGFSAPVRVDDDLTEEDLIVLSRHDSATTSIAGNRCRVLATRILLRGVKAIRAGRAPERNGGLVAAFGALIEDVRAGRIDHATFAAPGDGPGRPKPTSRARSARTRRSGRDPRRAARHMRGALGRTYRWRASAALLHAELAEFLALPP